MLALSSLLDPRILQIVLADPTQLSSVVDTEQIHLILKIITLLFLLVYIIFSIFFILQMRRTEEWLMSLKAYHFPRWAWVHFSLALAGWIVALIIL